MSNLANRGDNHPEGHVIEDMERAAILARSEPDPDQVRIRNVLCTFEQNELIDRMTWDGAL